MASDYDSDNLSVARELDDRQHAESVGDCDEDLSDVLATPREHEVEGRENGERHFRSLTVRTTQLLSEEAVEQIPGSPDEEYSQGFPQDPVRSSDWQNVGKGVGGSMGSNLESPRVQVSSESPEPEIVQHKSIEEIMKQTPFCHRSLWVLSSSNMFRRIVVRVVTHKAFEIVVMLAILVNCVLLAMFDPTLAEDDPKNEQLELGGMVLTAAFTLEMLLKIVAYGFWRHPGAYLRDGWNVVDFVIVLTGLVEFLPLESDSGSLSALRTFRVFRPLRTITGIPGVRILVNTLLSSLPLLLNVVVLFSFVCVLFGVFGVALFAGAMRQRCVTVEDGPFTKDTYAEDDGVLCGYRSCPPGTFCRETDNNPAWNLNSFDNILIALLTIFQCITLEGWIEVVYQLQDSYHPAVWVYFVILIVIGAFVVVNLTLAILSTSFNKFTKMAEEFPEVEKASLSARAVRRMSSWITAKEKRYEWRVKLKEFVESTAFSGFIVFAILVNTVTLSLEHYRMSDDLVDFLQISNFVLTGIFVVEMILKLLALGPVKYVSDRMNVFDGIVVIASVIELFFSQESSVSALRAFRLLRLFKLARSWKSLRSILEIIGKSISSLGYFSLLVFVLLFIFALLGMQLFGDRMRVADDPTQVPRWHFDDLFSAFLTVFVILTGENWNEIMWDAARETGYGATVYFIVLVVVGNFIVLNVFLAILLQNFAGIRAERNSTNFKKMKFKMKVFTALSSPIGALGSLTKRRSSRSNSVEAPASTSSMTSPPSLTAYALANVPEEPDKLSEPKIRKSRGSSIFSRIPSMRSFRNSIIHKISPDSEPVPTKEDDLERDPDMQHSSDEEEEEEGLVRRPMMGVALCCWSTENRFRAAVHRFTYNKYFEGFIFVIIILNSISLALQSPELEESGSQSLIDVLDLMDLVFTIIFTIEFTLKVFSLGFIMHSGSYLRDSWNILDMTVVVISLLSISLKSSSLESLKSLRTIKALGPLRVIGRSSGMKVVVNTLASSIPAVRNVVLVVFFFYFIFGILGVQLFSGKLYNCIDPQWVTESDCLANGSSWYNASAHFDDIFHALLTLFELATLEQWNSLMYMGMDAVGQGQAMVTNYNPVVALYFVMFIIVGSFFAVNLFVGAVIENYTKIQADSNGHALLTDDQAKWVETQTHMLRQRPMKLLQPPTNPWRKKAFRLVMHDYFEVFIIVWIIINTITMCFEHYQQPDEMTDFLHVSNFFFTILFLLEAVLKIFAMDKHYFKDAWNLFDLFIVVGSVAGLFLEAGAGASLIRIVRIERLFRVARLFRLIRGLRGLRTIFRTFVLSLPSFINVGVLMILLFFVYAILGMNLFGGKDEGAFLNRHANFNNFPTAMLTLFRMSTGESWNGVMHDAMGCVDLDCGSDWASFYFVSFVTIGSFMIVNLFIAVILDNFGHIVDDAKQVLSEDSVSAFREAWAQFDPDATGFVSMDQFVVLLKKIDPPLGLGKAATTSEIRRLINSLHIPVYHSGVMFRDALDQLGHNHAGVELPSVKTVRELETKRSQQSMKYASTTEVATDDIDLAFAAMSFQKLYRGYQARKRMKAKLENESPRTEGGANGDNSYAGMSTDRLESVVDSIYQQATGTPLGSPAAKRQLLKKGGSNSDNLEVPPVVAIPKSEGNTVSSPRSELETESIPSERTLEL